MAITRVAVLAEAAVSMRVLDAAGGAVPPPTQACIVAPTPTPDPTMHLHASVFVAVALPLAPQSCRRRRCSRLLRLRRLFFCRGRDPGRPYGRLPRIA